MFSIARPGPRRPRGSPTTRPRLTVVWCRRGPSWTRARVRYSHRAAWRRWGGARCGTSTGTFWAPLPPRIRPSIRERWLDPLHRGALLHRVYDRLLREARGQNIAFNDDRFLQIGLTLLREEAELTRVRTPAPSDAVFDRECEELALDVASFVGMTAQDAPDWAETEMRFGFGDEDRPAVLIQLESGSIRIRGAVDRIDRMLGDSLRVVDYKTGSARSHGTSSTWKGGRRLQHYLYSRAAERLLAAPVARMEYHFPTRKGENRRSVFAREQLEGGAELVERLLDVAASGQFLPTDDKEDCKFCDFQERVSRSAGGLGCAVSSGGLGRGPARRGCVREIPEGPGFRGRPMTARSEQLRLDLTAPSALTDEPGPMPGRGEPESEGELPDEAARRRIETDLDTNILVEAAAGSGKDDGPGEANGGADPRRHGRCPRDRGGDVHA